MSERDRQLTVPIHTKCIVIVSLSDWLSVIVSLSDWLQVSQLV